MTKITNIKYLIFFMFLLVLSSIVLAVPPFQISDDPNKGTVIFPKIDYFPENTNFTLHFHFLNSSGKQLLNTEYDCLIHLYNNVNFHIKDINLLPDSNGIDKYIDIPSTIPPKLKYSYLVTCNSTEGEYGFVSNSFEINDGGLTTIFEYRLYAVLLSVLILFSIMSLVISSTIKDKKLNTIKLMFFMLSVFFLCLTLIFPYFMIVNSYSMLAVKGIFAGLMSIGIIIFIGFIYFYFTNKILGDVIEQVNK